MFEAGDAAMHGARASDAARRGGRSTRAAGRRTAASARLHRDGVVTEFLVTAIPPCRCRPASCPSMCASDLVGIGPGAERVEQAGDVEDAMANASTQGWQIVEWTQADR